MFKKSIVFSLLMGLPLALLSPACAEESSGSVGSLSEIAGADAQSISVTVYAACEDLNNVGYQWHITISPAESAEADNAPLWEWEGVFESQNVSAEGSFSLPLTAGVPFTLWAKFTEEDAVTDDGSAGSVTYTPTESDILNGFSLTLTVNVIEGEGRFSGHNALWKVNFLFGAAVEAAQS